MTPDYWRGYVNYKKIISDRFCKGFAIKKVFCQDLLSSLATASASPRI